ncbi:MAG: carboxypeptidase-like regulatory domain-containing protein [Bacteroidales bacterium]|nr:carboxypeptidase-like regulatory domain-containing protein [Bacteroidales bacterium]
MKHLLLMVFLFVFIFATSMIRGQVLSTAPEMIDGIIYDDSTGQALPYVQVYNESKRAGYLSNKEGEFRMQADIGDTLVFSAMGYLGKVDMVGDLNMDSPMVVRLMPRFYEIAAVSVTHFGTYEEFKRSVIALELPQTETQRLRNHLFAYSHKDLGSALAEEEVRRALSPEPGKPLGGLSVPILSREDKQRIHLTEVIEKEKRQHQIDLKYNREIIKKVTHLPDEEIIDFMGFCNFSDAFLLNASDYDIVVMIERKYKEYLQKKSRGDLPNQEMELMV